MDILAQHSTFPDNYKTVSTMRDKQTLIKYLH